MLLDNSIDGCEAESRAFANILRREERFKNMSQRRRIHAAACVADAQAHKTSRARLRMRFRENGVNRHRGEVHGERAAARHGVARIDGKVHDDLLDHPGITLDKRQFVRRMEFERDVLADEAFQHFAHVADRLAQVERLELHDIFAAEHEQLARELGGAFGGEKNVLDRINDFRRQRRFGEERARMPRDDREHIVEVVRDAATGAIAPPGSTVA